MKKIIGVALILVVVLFALPFVVRQAQDTGQDPQPTAQEEAALPDSGHTLRVKGSDGQVTEMDLNQYLWGVVAAEMPASFSQEALKAQAVAARTYALNKGPSSNHPDADLCTDYACCQAWIARDKAQGNWGDKAAEYTNKITTAVAETGNQVILYQGQLIDAVFHSSSSAATQDAVEVWGNSVPYLQSVDSPEGEGVPNYESQVTLTTQEFKDAFLKAQPTASLEGDPASWVGTIERTQSGSVHAITIGGVTVSGAQARQIFSLRSASFDVSLSGDTFTFSVTGFGHGVGRSQYGADAMAEEGKGYVEILQHYYTGVTVEECPAEYLPQYSQTRRPAAGIPRGRAFLWEKGCALGRIGCKIASIKTFRGGVSGEMWRRRPLMIRVLLWDVDNTLLDFPAAERRALQETFAQFRLGPCPEDRVERYAALNASYWRRLERGEITKAQLLPGRFQEFFQREGIACTDYDQVNAAYQCHLGDTVVFLDQSYDLVRDLRGRVKQYAVTNGTRTAQERKLARSGLGDLFDGVFISEVVGAEKPSLDFFRPVLEAIGPYDREELLLIGDSLTSDMEGGSRAGIPCCWYNPKGLPRPDRPVIRYEVRNLNQVREIVAGKC